MTSKFGKTLLVAALVLYFLFVVVANIPARLLASIVHKQVPVVWLNSVEGTIWNGRAAASQIDVKPVAIPLGKISWELNPWSLLALNPCVKFETSQKGQNISGTLCHGVGGRSSVENVAVDSSMAIISGLVGTDLKGRGSLEVQSAEFTQSQIKKLSASLTWQNSRIFVIDEWLALGSYVAKFRENENGGVTAEVFNMEAPLTLKMTADWTAKQGWGADGTVQPGPGTPEKIVEGLKAFGEEIEPGNYKFTWR